MKTGRILSVATVLAGLMVAPPVLAQDAGAAGPAGAGGGVGVGASPGAGVVGTDAVERAVAQAQGTGDAETPEGVQAVENEDGTVTLIINGQSITLDAESANEINTALGSANPEDVATAVQNVVARVSASAAAAGGDAAADEAAAAVATFVADRATSASQVEAATRGAIRARPTAAATVTTRVAVSAGAQRTGATAQSLATAVNADAQISNEAKQATNTVAQSQQPTAAPPITPQQQLAAQPGDENEPNPNQDVSPTN